MSSKASLAAIERRVVACTRCPELRAYCAEIARVKKREHRDRPYWGRPVPAFGDPNARFLIVGLAPGAHGSNRTGRPFTGDASGVWLYRALHRAGFANQPEQRDREDGMQLHDTLISAALHCAPPGNQPTPQQLQRCRLHLDAEMDALRRLRVVLGLGGIGTRAAGSALGRAGYVFENPMKFGHGAEAVAAKPGTSKRVVLLASYHPSRQNTNTGVLTEAMFDSAFKRVRALLELA